MRSSDTTTPAILDAWRAQGADRIDPIAFHRMAALQRRVATHDGDTQRALEERLSALIQAYAGEMERVAAAAADDDRATLPQASAHGMLRELVDELASRAAARDGIDGMGEAEPRSAFPEMAALDDFRKIWAGVRADSQMQRSLQPSPTDAGPLNSSRLVHRSLMLMRGLSPGYLQQFLSYVDALSWLQQMSDSGALGGKDPTRQDNGRTRPGHTPRKRRG